MNRAQKGTITGALVATALMVFVPSIYVTISTKLGKLAEIRSAGVPE